MAHEGSHAFNAREQHNVHLHPLLHHNICTATARAAFYLLPWISGGDTRAYRLRVTVEMGSTLRRIVRLVALRFRLPSA